MTVSQSPALQACRGPFPCRESRLAAAWCNPCRDPSFDGVRGRIALTGPSGGFSSIGSLGKVAAARFGHSAGGFLTDCHNVGGKSRARCPCGNHPPQIVHALPAVAVHRERQLDQGKSIEDTTRLSGLPKYVVMLLATEVAATRPESEVAA